MSKAKRTGIAPLMDEDAILEDLQRSLSKLKPYLPELQRAACATMCDVYDRGVEREQFTEMMAPCVALYGSLSRLSVLKNIREAMINDACTLEEIDAAIGQVIQEANGYKSVVRSVVEALKLCPSATDRVQ